MKFAHLADVHIGAWRDPKLADLPNQAFRLAIEQSLAAKVDFVLIAGDLFNAALPGIDHLRATVRTLQLCKAAGVPVYCIPGSHDFSPSGKSMLHVLEEAGLLKNVFRGEVVDGQLRLELTKDRSGVLLTGVLGRRGMLDRAHYDELDKDFLQKGLRSPSVFLFHTSLDELKPKSLSQMESSSVSVLPKGFDYYAGGHVHIVEEKSLPGYPFVVYPGPVFPASFAELEKLGGGSFVIFDGKVNRVPLVLKEVFAVDVKVDDKSPEQVTDMLLDKIIDVADKLVLLRVHGTLKSGARSDIDFSRVVKTCFGKGAFFVMRNTAGLVAEKLDDEPVVEGSPHDIEERVIKEHSGQVSHPFADEVDVAQKLLRVLAASKKDGETVAQYDERVTEDALRVLKLSDD